MIHSSSKNHSLSSDKDLAVGSSYDEWREGITIERMRHGDGGAGKPPVVTETDVCITIS